MALVALSAPAPLTTRACADFLGFSPQWIRGAIDAGVDVNGMQVRLPAEAIAAGGRRRYRIHFDQFVTFLRALGWQRLPASADDVRAPRRERAVREAVTAAATR